MTVEEAEKKLEQIASLALEIVRDKELYTIDERYSILARYIETDVDNICLD